MDTENQVARLPDDKLLKCLSMIKDFLYRKKVTLKELQSLCGLLNFACQVVLPGRAFLRRLFDLTRGLQKPHHRVISSEKGVQGGFEGMGRISSSI